MFEFAVFRAAFLYVFDVLQCRCLVSDMFPIMRSTSVHNSMISEQMETPPLFKFKDPHGTDHELQTLSMKINLATL